MLLVGEDEDMAARLGVPVGVHCTALVLGLWLGVQLYMSVMPRYVRPCGFGVWESPKGRILRVM